MDLLTTFASRATGILLLGGALLLFTEETAQAYIDPGTGSIILQAAMGVLLASLFALKVFWFRVKTFVTITVLRREPKQDVEADDADFR